jgi:5-(carboxyamino)imidazole ribonucleotide synthase
MPVLPGSTIGMIGGGQLGRMFVMAARRMGYEVVVLDPDPHSPGGGMATEHIYADYDDEDALDRMALSCEVITTEFENIPVSTLEYLARKRPVHPSAKALAIAQNRILEKSFIQSLGLDTAPFITIECVDDLKRSLDLTYPAVLKTATLGYDGKGQVVCNNEEELAKAYQQMLVPCVLEQFMQLDKEISVVLARNLAGESFCYPAAENSHTNGILDVSVAPARVSAELQQKAQQAAKKIAQNLDYIGVLAVEFFISADGKLLVNEIAPRPHNSGHYTMDACYSSQFEQQVRMVCGLPSANCDLHTPVVMLNLLGDVWPHEGQPDWRSVAAIDRACLHLYGKKHARAGRKMGHINILADDHSSATLKLKKIRKILAK